MSKKNILQKQKELTEIEQRNWKKCNCCGEKKPDVKLTTNPFAEEMCGDHTLYLLCKNCCYESAQDI